MVYDIAWNSAGTTTLSPLRDMRAEHAFASAVSVSKAASVKEPDPGKPTKTLSQYADGVIDWWSGVLKGDFEENPTIGQTVTRSLLTMIPFVDQGGDIQDLTANLYKCYQKGRIEASDGLAIALTAVGAIPELGSALKGSFKIILQASKELAANKAGDAVALARKLFAMPMVRNSIDRFLANAQDLRKDMIAGINTALDQIAKLNPDLAGYVARKRASLVEAAAEGFDALRDTLADTKKRLMAPIRQTPAAPAGYHAPGPTPPGNLPSFTPQKYFTGAIKPAIRDYPWGKAVHIDAFPANLSIQDRALYIRDAMNVAGIDQVVLPKGGDKGQIMAALQLMEGREFLYARALDGAHSAERVIVRGNDYSVRLPSFDLVPIAHTHPPSSLEKWFGEFISVMPSDKDIEVLRESGGYVSSTIISTAGQARRHFDFRQILANPRMKASLAKLSMSGRQAMRQHIVEQKLAYEEMIFQFGRASDLVGPKHKRYSEFLTHMTSFNELIKDCNEMEKLINQLPRTVR